MLANTHASEGAQRAAHMMICNKHFITHAGTEGLTVGEPPSMQTDMLNTDTCT